jgi:hypothetical protein
MGALGAVTILAAVLMITRGKAAAAKATVATPVAEPAPSAVVAE